MNIILYIFFFFIFINSIIFINLNHPLSMGFILMFQTFLTSIFSGLMTKTFWFSYSLFLIFMGGMLILIMYMTSLAFNELFYILNNKIKMIFFSLFLFFNIFLFYKFLNLFNFNNLENQKIFFF